MKLLAIDPSSTRTGYAVMGGPTELVDAGYLTPARAKDGVELRIEAMVADLREVLQEYQPDHVVIEVPSGRKGRGYAAGGGARLATYGRAVGHFERVVWDVVGVDHVSSVTEREWTKRRTPAQRAAFVRQCFPAQTTALEVSDKGHDVSDAIGIGLWWLERHQY